MLDYRGVITMVIVSPQFLGLFPPSKWLSMGVTKHLLSRMIVQVRVVH